jgi:hypothetical protein
MASKNVSTTTTNKRGENKMNKSTTTKTTTTNKRGAKEMNKTTTTKKTTTAKKTATKKTVEMKPVVTSVYNSRGKLIPAVLGIPYVDADSFKLLAEEAHLLYGRCTKGEWHFRQGHADDAVAFVSFVKKNVSKLVFIDKPAKSTKKRTASKVVSGEVETLTERVEKLEKSTNARFKKMEDGIKGMCSMMQGMMDKLDKLTTPKPAKRITGKATK